MPGHHGIFHRCHGGKEADVLEGPGNTFAENSIGPIAQDTFSVKDYIPLRCLVHAGKHVKYRGFPCAVGANKSDHPTITDGKAQAGQGQKPSKPNTDVF